jgi:glycosyltransferase involved in cell wall biosynthesis
MTGAPLVSVVVNNHNYAAYLGHAIRSALGQTYRPLEVVVVDDGSTDDSRDVIASFGDRIAGVLKENGGQASALNAGFNASAGALVLFLDADDALDPDAVATAVAGWRPGVAKVHFPLRVMDADGKPLEGRRPPDRLEEGDLREAVLNRGRYASPPTSGNLFSRDALERLMPVPESDWTRCADRYLNLLAPLVGEIVAIDRPLGWYREHDRNAWALTRLDVARVREHLAMDRSSQAALARWLEAEGSALRPDWPERMPTHLQSRLASLRLDPDRHPYPDDRAWRLARRGVRASLARNGFAARKRILFAAWFLLVGLLPRALAEPLIAMSFVPRSRPRALRAVMRAA